MWKEVIILCVLIFWSIQDIKTGQLPLLSLVLALAAALLWKGFAMEVSARELLLLGLSLLPGVAMLLLALTSKAAGTGDGLALIVLGVILGLSKILLLLCVSLCLMSLVSLFLLVCKKVSKQTRIPYLPFLTAGYLVLLFG